MLSLLEGNVFVAKTAMKSLPIILPNTSNLEEHRFHTCINTKMLTASKQNTKYTATACIGGQSESANKPIRSIR